jgi:hypothetical protein
MNKIAIIYLISVSLIAISDDIYCQNKEEQEKYKVYTDAITQIQYDNVIKRAGISSYKDTTDYYPVLIRKTTVYENDSVGFMLYKSLRSDKSIFALPFLNLEKFAVINNNKLVCLDTTFILLQYRLDSLSKAGHYLSNSFYFPYRTILTNKLTDRKYCLFKPDLIRFWNRFYKRYPNSFGIFEVSDVFFSPDNSTAILYIGYHRQGLTGYGGVYLLKKVNGKWVILKNREIWIA